MESGQGDLGTLANVVTSLANLTDSLKENLNNGDTSDSQQEEQSASEITRSVGHIQSVSFRGSSQVLRKYFCFVFCDCFLILFIIVYAKNYVNKYVFVLHAVPLTLWPKSSTHLKQGLNRTWHRSHSVPVGLLSSWLDGTRRHLSSRWRDHCSQTAMLVLRWVEWVTRWKRENMQSFSKKLWDVLKYLLPCILSFCYINME